MAGQLIKNANIFGRIGSGLGKGLGEQLPKEIERGRLQAGLKNFNENMAGKNPIQLSSELIGTPGMTPEYYYSLAPLLKEYQAREAGGIKGTEGTPATNPANGQPYSPGNMPNASPSMGQNGTQPYAEQSAKAGQNRTLKPIEATQAQLTPIQKRSETELYNDAAKISKENPTQFPTPQSALSLATANENARISNLQENRSVGDAADTIGNRLRTGIQKGWDKEKSSTRIPDTVQTRLLSKAEAELADPKNKLSEQQIQDKYRKIGDDLSRQDAIMEERSKHGWLSGNYTPTKIENTLDEARKAAKKAGSLPEHQDLIATRFNLDGPGSAYLTYPPANKQANKVVNSIPLTNKGIPNNEDVKKYSIQMADELSQVLNTSEDSEDSILSYLLQGKYQKQIDPQLVISRFKQNEEAGLWKPNTRQSEELSKGYPLFPALGNIYLYSLLNKEKLMEE